MPLDPWRSFPRGAGPDGLTPEVVFVYVSYNEKALREQVRAAGGRWDKRLRAWELRFEHVARLGLKHRIQFLTDAPFGSHDT